MGNLIKIITQTGPDSFAIEAHSSLEASSHITLPTLEGYTRLIYFLKPVGNAAVIGTGPNSNWVTNTGLEKANSIRIDTVGIFIKNQ